MTRPADVAAIEDENRALRAEIAHLRARLDERSGGEPRPRRAGWRTTPAGPDALASAVEKARVPMILTDPNRPDDPIIFANRAFQELSGYDAEDLLGRNCRFLQGPDTDPAAVQRIRDALREGRDVSVDILNYHRDGTPFVNELYISPVLGEDGRVLYHFGSQFEVTRQREDRRRVDTSEARQRAVFDSIVDFAIIVTDRDGRVTEWNTGAERVLGWSADEMRGRTVERIFTPEDRAAGRVEEETRLALAHGQASDERWHLRADGERFWVSGEMMPLRDAAGGQGGFVKVLRDRTEQRRAGERLAESEARYRTLFESIDEGFCIIEFLDGPHGPLSDYVHVEANPAYARHAGIPNVVGQRVRAMVPDEAEGWIAIYGAVLRTGEPIRFERELVATGRRLAISAFRVESAERRQVAVLFQDVSEAARARERVRLAIEATGVGIFDYDLVTGELGWDARVRELFGVGPDAPVTYDGTFLPGLHPDDRARADAAVQGALDPAGPGRFDIEYRVRPLDGRAERWLAARGQAVVVGGHTARFVGTVRDVTAARTAEEALRATEERYRLATRATNDAIWDWDLATDHVLWNEALTAAYGHAVDVVKPTGDWWIATIHPDDQARVVASIHAVIDGTGAAWTDEYRFRRADGTYADVLDRGSVIRDAEGRAMRMIGAMLDLSERKRAEAALRSLNETLESRVDERTAELMRAEEALRQSQKMEAVGQLTGGVAHDFNNLLAGITGSLELMQTRISQGRIKDIDRFVAAAQGAAKRAAALTHRLLAFSRRQTLDPRPTDVNALVNGMTELIQRSVGPSIPVEVVGASGLWPALVDASQLENALLNLCINARDAMPDGGRITIETANKWLDREASRIHDVPEGQYLSLCVTDTGTGMTPEVIAKAFEPFFTTKPIGQGTGLGLSMIYGFAKQSGGQVRIYSEVGQGTTVCLYLPRHYGEATADAAASAATPIAFAEAGETVLVVDDEPTVRMLVTEVLEDLGYTAIEAADSVAGLKVLRSDVRIDLLVTDVGLPGGMNGRQMADAGRERRPDLKVLFITGYAENAAIGNGHLAPGMQVLTKPFAVDALAARIRELVSG